MKRVRLRIGPAIFELRSPFRSVLTEVEALYRRYPQNLDGEIFDFSVTGLPVSPWRRFLRPSIMFGGDFSLADIVPVEKRLGLLGFEMAINLQMALGYLRHIVVHAASAAKDDEAILITGESGSGKSTLSALLSYQARWRHMGDELALLSLETRPLLHPYPRPISLKNESIPVMESRAPEDRFGPLLTDTVKGDVRHLVPPQRAIEQMDRPALPKLVICPHFEAGREPAVRRMTESECYVRLSTASTNQLRLGERGFDAMVSLVKTVPAYDISYGSSEDALKLVDELWQQA
ncbi:HprK-related kinase A [Pacificimonas flava]|uniref:HprK-related kinase A n=2 Tax=Pacificimonas TaxID=1960290 RepID=A0A219B6H4_9SPHN|nr:MULTISPECIES: HprK-related kinase A [Pacificimonas]MBZ6378778.1 HprK-related kinase A [Pacificimonas aurantium]OWV33960.1 HprK-related kinase A [Pacificimonas flava]